MLRDADQIRLDPRVQIVIDMDGFGPDWMKRGSYRAYRGVRSVAVPGIQVVLQERQARDDAPRRPGLFPAPAFVHVPVTAGFASPCTHRRWLATPPKSIIIPTPLNLLTHGVIHASPVVCAHLPIIAAAAIVVACSTSNSTAPEAGL